MIGHPYTRTNRLTAWGSVYGHRNASLAQHTTVGLGDPATVLLKLDNLSSFSTSSTSRDDTSVIRSASARAPTCHRLHRSSFISSDIPGRPSPPPTPTSTSTVAWTG